MSIAITCSTCEMRYRAPDELEGKKVACPDCGEPIDVPIPFDEPDPEIEDLPLLDEEFIPEKELPPTPGTRITTVEDLTPPKKKPVSVLGLIASLVLLIAAGAAYLVCRRADYIPDGVGILLASVGGVIALFGVVRSLPPFTRSAGDRSREWYIGDGLAGVGITLLSAIIFLGNKHHSPAYVIGQIVAAFIGVLLVYMVLRTIFRRAGLFPAAALLYLVVLGVFGAVLVFPSFQPLEWMKALKNRIEPEVDPSEPFPLADVPRPRFPHPGEPKLLEPGVNLTEVSIDVPAGDPGQQNTLYVYTPAGEHEPGSLPCVFIAPAGTNFLSGSKQGPGARPEHLPYVKAGYAVVAYEIDGPLPDDPTEKDVGEAYEKFTAAYAGLVNARNAIDYVLTKFPEIDPNRLCAAGHSSAATLALLLAAHEPRIKACIAYAPVTDVYATLLAVDPDLDKVMPNSETFLRRSSPITHASRIDCPVFLFCSKRDTTVSPAESMNLFHALQKAGKKNVTMEDVDEGDHYNSMISEGIPRALRWMAFHVEHLKEVEPVEWSVAADPAPKGEKQLGAIQLHCFPPDLDRVMFSPADKARAVVMTRGNAYQPDAEGLSQYGLHLYDLAENRYFGRTDLPDGAVLCGFSPNGRISLTVDGNSAEIWFLEKQKSLKRWEFGKAPKDAAGSGIFVDKKHVATLDEQGGAIVWAVPDCTEVYRLDGVASLGRSPGGKYLIALKREDPHWVAEIYETVTGELRGQIPLPSASPYTALSHTVNSDGTRLATNGVGMLGIWDLVEGKLVSRSDAANTGARCKAFLGNDYLLLGNFIFDRARGVRLWKYDPQWNSVSWDKVFGSPDGRVWVPVANGEDQPVYLTPIELPTKEVAEKIAAIPPGRPKEPGFGWFKFDTAFPAGEIPPPPTKVDE